MNEFGFWTSWGTGLGDAEFASAWVALGLAARAASQAGATFRTELERALARGERDGEQGWSFPPSADAKRLAALVPPGDAASWAKLWTEAAPAAFGPIRLRVTGAPPDEAAPPWFRMLSEAVPAPACASMVLRDRPLEPEPEWPARVAVLPGGLGPLALHGNYRRVETAEPSEVLVHLGDPESFLRASGGTRTGAAHVVVLRCNLNRPWRELERGVEKIGTQRSASGWVLLSEHASDEDVARVLDAAVREAGHGAPLDVAFAHARSSSDRFDLILGLTPALAAFRYAVRMAKAAPPPATNGPPRPVVHGAFRGPAAPPAAPSAPKPFSAPPPAPPLPPAAAPQATVGAPPPGVERYLQQQAFVRDGPSWAAAEGGFVANAPARVRVRIGPRDEEWDSNPEPIEKQEIPLGAKLTVWLTELDHLSRGVRGELEMGADGTTVRPCDLEFVAGTSQRFEGRLVVLYRNRVIQTAVLRAAVRRHGEAPAPDGTPKLHARLPVGRRDESRRPLDLAFVLNHDERDQPRSVALSDERAWVADLSQSIEIAKEINARLSPVANSVADYADGLAGKKGRALFVQLAQLGKSLHIFLVEQQLENPANRAEVAKAEYLQIVSTRADAVVPFEFIYDRPAPEDGATICEYWREALAPPAAPAPAAPPPARCSARCDPEATDVVCPLAFWGLQKVIERHAFAPQFAKEGYPVFVQSEPERTSDTLALGGVAVVAASSRIPDASLAPVIDALETRAGAAPLHPRTWDAWPDLVKGKHPRLVFALAHTDGHGTGVTLEIGGVARKAILVDKKFVHPVEADPPPLVALLGCDTAGTAEDYGVAVPALRSAGAAVVIATIATVFGEHAAQVAQRLVEGLLPEHGAPPVRLGEALRDLKRKALLDGLLMPLCLVAYGDADWKLTR